MRTWVCVAFLVVSGCGSPPIEKPGCGNELCTLANTDTVCCAGYQCSNGLCKVKGSEHCATNYDCGQGLECVRGLAFCAIAKNLPIGENCRANSECTSGVCNAVVRTGGTWCTMPCTTNAQCGAANSCVAFTGMPRLCVPNCAVTGMSATICSQYNLAFTYACQTVTTVDGSKSGVCVEM